MDKVEKFLKKLSPAHRQIVKAIITQVLSGNVKGLDIKKLKVQSGLFRVRVGDIRVVFYQAEGSFTIVFIGQRGDSKYKRF